MCYINYSPDPELYHFDYISPGPRPLPRIAWVLPVDIVELGASLEAYAGLSLQVTTLRLIHRFDTGALSKLSQEILDLIINHLHESERAANRAEWVNEFACFQGACTMAQHFPSFDYPTEEIEETWCGLFANHTGWCRPGEELRSEDFTHEEKAEMIDEELCKNDSYRKEKSIIHQVRQMNWVDRLCLCDDTTTDSNDQDGFGHFQEILKKRFGLEALILHEALPKKMQTFLPGYNDAVTYNTACFLTLASPKDDGLVPHSRTARQANGQFLKSGNSLAFYQNLGPTQLEITEEQRIRFARALRVLILRPHFHLSELGRCIDSSTKDARLWEIGDVQIKDCPAPNPKMRLWKKKKKLQQYLQQKDEEVAKGSWPQLMHIATSSVVGPTVG